MSKGNGKRRENRHANRLVRSSHDLVSLTIAVVQRYNELIDAHARITGNRLVIPDSLIPDFHNVNRLSKRLYSGDYRHRASEWSSLKTFAQWTVDVNRRIRNQEPKQVVWGEE